MSPLEMPLAGDNDPNAIVSPSRYDSRGTHQFKPLVDRVGRQDHERPTDSTWIPVRTPKRASTTHHGAAQPAHDPFATRKPSEIDDKDCLQGRCRATRTRPDRMPDPWNSKGPPVCTHGSRRSRMVTHPEAISVSNQQPAKEGPRLLCLRLPSTPIRCSSRT